MEAVGAGGGGDGCFDGDGDERFNLDAAGIAVAGPDQPALCKLFPQVRRGKATSYQEYLLIQVSRLFYLR